MLQVLNTSLICCIVNACTSDASNEPTRTYPTSKSNSGTGRVFRRAEDIVHWAYDGFSKGFVCIKGIVYQPEHPVPGSAGIHTLGLSKARRSPTFSNKHLLHGGINKDRAPLSRTFYVGPVLYPSIAQFVVYGRIQSRMFTLIYFRTYPRTVGPLTDLGVQF